MKLESNTKERDQRMQTTTNGKNRAEAGETIYGDRRADKRYPIELELRYKLIRRKKVLETGVGRTLDLSSGGIMFETERPLPPGFSVELAINWPVLLRNIAPLHLMVKGKVVRTEEARTAIRMSQHEFRTVGARDAVAAGRAAAIKECYPARVQPGVFVPAPAYSESRKVN
jgi:hypothetical protein